MRAVLSLLTTVLFVLGSPLDPPASAATPDTAVDAQKIYHDFCSVCHGDRGDGRSHAMGGLRPPPRDFTTPGAAAELTRERMLVGVREGRPGTAMAPWKNQLSEAEIAAVVDYIRRNFMVPMANADAGDGRQLYAENCSVCHGDQGQGAIWTRQNLNPPPRDFTSERAHRELSRERMLQSVTYGRPDTAMPGFGTQLSDAQIASVVDYVRDVFMNVADMHAGGGASPPVPAAVAGDAQGAAGAEMSAALPASLTGDPDRGQALYLQNCVACHGIEGDGQGPRAYFIIPKPRNFTHPASRHALNRPALFQAISKGTVGTEMPAWEKVLDAQAIADLSEYVFRRFIQSRADG